MKVSIIIPTIRLKKLIDFQLPSFSKQTFPKEEFEIIIIDDYIYNNGSNRKEEVENFAKTNNLNIKWMPSKKPYYRSNACMGCARNTGLINAQGELVVFNDDFSYVKPRYIEKVWNIYKDNPKISNIGACIFTDYKEPPYPENIESIAISKDPRHKSSLCSCDIFFTSNASAPLKDIVKVNGFWEMADLTREEDVLMGYALSRIGRKFCFNDEQDLSVYHMSHHGHSEVPQPFKSLSFEDLGWKENVKGKCGLNTNTNEIQLVTKDVFNTKNYGSWALIEHFKNNRYLKFNKEIGFDLLEERKKIGL